MSIKDLTCESCHALGPSSSCILNCGHVKCISCLENSSYEGSSEHSLCGECNKKNVRVETKRQEHNFLHSKVNLLTNVMKSFSEENSDAECFLCIQIGENKPEYFCFDTNQYYCRPHFERHNLKKDCVFLSKEESLDENFTSLQCRNDHEPMCSEHSNRHATYFCIEDKKFVCSKCDAEHKGHEQVNVTEAVEKARIVLETENRIIEESRNELKRRAQNLQEKCDWEKQQHRNKEKGVLEFYTEEIRKLEKQRDEKLAQMSSEYKEKSNLLEEEKQNNEISLQTIYRFDNISKLCIQILSSSEQTANTVAIQDLLRNAHNKTEPKSKPVIEPQDTVIEPRTPKKLSRHHSYKSEVKTDIIVCPDEAKILSDVTVDKNNNIYVADCTNKSILAFNESGKLFRRYLLHSFRNISQCSSIPNICYFSERIIFTTSDPNKAYELNINDGSANELVERFLFIPGRPFIKPLGMATSVDKKFLYICDQSDNQVHIINERLKKEDSIPNIPQPVGISIAPNSNIYILTKGSSSQILLLRDKVVRYTIDLIGAQIEYITSNHLNQILISDMSRHHVVVYSQEGEKLKTMCGFSQSEQIRDPVGLTMDCIGRLVVAEMSSKQIKIFSNITFQQ